MRILPLVRSEAAAGIKGKSMVFSHTPLPAAGGVYGVGDELTTSWKTLTSAIDVHGLLACCASVVAVIFTYLAGLVTKVVFLVVASLLYVPSPTSSQVVLSVETSILCPPIRPLPLSAGLGWMLIACTLYVVFMSMAIQFGKGSAGAGVNLECQNVDALPSSTLAGSFPASKLSAVALQPFRLIETEADKAALMQRELATKAERSKLILTMVQSRYLSR